MTTFPAVGAARRFGRRFFLCPHAPRPLSRFTSVLPAIALLDTAHNTTMRPSSSLLRALARASAPRPLKASPAEHIPAPAKRLLHTCTLRTSPVIRPSPVLSRARALAARRFESSSAAPTPPTTSTKAPESRLDREQIPSYELTFTCNVCKTRSSHRMSKQGYHKGTILISCPDCKNRHLISDHLKVR
jgi:protein import protein ZIM17